MDINIEFARKTSLAYNRTCKSLCQELKLHADGIRHSYVSGK